MIQLQNLISRIGLIRLGDFTLPRREEGQTLVEYALILFFIAILVIAVLIALQGKITSVFSSIVDAL